MQVVINLTRSADDLISEFSAGAKLYLYSAATENGSYSAVGSGTLIVSGTQRYEVYDASGTPGTTWYKFRAGNSAGNSFSEYSDPWLSTSLRAYATLDDVRQTAALGSTDTGHDSWFETALEAVSDDIDATTGRRFYRSPQVTGTTTVYFDTFDCSRSLAEATRGHGTSDGQALDIVSVSNLYIRDDESSAYVELSQVADVDYFLQPGRGPGIAGTTWPYEDIVLSPVSTSHTYFPTGFRAVKLVGVLGFPSVPSVVRQATVSEVRERWRQSVSGGAAPQGVNQFGTPIFLTGDSPDMRRLMRWPYSKRTWVA